MVKRPQYLSNRHKLLLGLKLVISLGLKFREVQVGH